MPLQNRVNPWGAIEAVAARGTMMGNRGGKFHCADKTLGLRRWASKHWIACELSWKGARHEPMGVGYTSLFFLDEVTALAAGHRPCFLCRRWAAKAFLGDGRVADFDLTLHAERLSTRPIGEIAGLPDGVMVEVEGAAFAVRGQTLLRWSHNGYVEKVGRKTFESGRVLTPRSILAILQSGYEPRWHPSAALGD